VDHAFDEFNEPGASLHFDPRSTIDVNDY